MCRGARSPTGSPTSYGSLATSTAVLVTSFTSPTTSLPNMPAALWPGIVQTYSNVPALFARNTIVVADPTPTRLSDWALNAGTAESCIDTSPLITGIANTDRQRGGEGKRVDVRVVLGGGCMIEKKKKRATK